MQEKLRERLNKLVLKNSGLLQEEKNVIAVSFDKEYIDIYYQSKWDIPQLENFSVLHKGLEMVKSNEDMGLLLEIVKNYVARHNKHNYKTIVVNGDVSEYKDAISEEFEGYMLKFQY